MRRLPPILLLLLATAAFGSGALRYVHELEHAAADAASASHHDDGHAHAGHGSGDRHEGHGHDHDHDDGGGGGSPVHDPADCFIHAQLNLPMHASGHVPLLVCLGLFVAFLSALPLPAARSRRPLLRLESRGPPAR